MMLIWACLTTVAAVLMTAEAVSWHRQSCRDLSARLALQDEVIRAHQRIRQFEEIVAADDAILTDAQEMQEEATNAMARQTLDLLEQMALRGVPADQQVDNLIDWLQSHTDVSVVTSFLERLHQRESLDPKRDPRYVSNRSPRTRPDR